MKNTHLAYVLGEFPSISETFILNEIHELQRLGFIIDIFALTDQRKTQIQPAASDLLPYVTYIPKPIRIHRPGRLLMQLNLPIKNLSTFMQLKKHYPNHYFCALWLAQHIKHRHIEHMHAHFPEPSLVALMAHLLTNIPFSFTIHSHLHNEEAYALKERVQHAQFVVTVGKRIKQSVLTIIGRSYGKKIFTVYCGINERLLALSRSINYSKLRNNPVPFRILTIGRLVQHKGIHVLIEAISKISNGCPNVRLTIIGDGPLRTHLKKRIEKFRLRTHIRLLGSVPHNKYFFRIISKSHAFILPCITDTEGNQDGLPVALLEAMIFQLPMISTPIGSIPEAVHKSNGILVQENNADALAKAITYMYHLSYEKRLVLGINGQKEIYKKFNLTKNVMRLATLFQTFSSL